MTAVCIWLTLVLVVIARWSTHLVVVFVTSSFLGHAMINNEYIKSSSQKNVSHPSQYLDMYIFYEIWKKNSQLLERDLN